MKRSFVVFLLGALWAALFAPGPVLAHPTGDNFGQPIPEAGSGPHDSLARLRDIPPHRDEHGGTRVNPLRPTPPGNRADKDGALQASAPGAAVGTTDGAGFAGVSACDGTSLCYAPPDTNGAVGATQYVQWVNGAFAVYGKSGGPPQYGPTAGNTLWTKFGGGCEANNDGDAIVQYDKTANRWVMTQFSVSNPSRYGYLQCVAVSQTSDATGAYNRYAFSYTNFPDYPKLGVWPDAYYITFNMFNSGSAFVGAEACAYNRAAMLNGQTATQQCFLMAPYGSLLPSDLDGATPPPVGSPNYLLNQGSSGLNLWKFHVDWVSPANSQVTGPTTISVASFTEACNGGACIPQPGTGQQLDSLGDRLMYRFAYRNFGDHESLVVNQSVQVGSFFSNQVGIRWYELRNPGASSPSVYQQGTYAPDATYRWMSSIAMDKAGDIALGYSVSDRATVPGIRYTGRVPSDPLGTLETEKTIVNGGGSQTATLSRWGDYTSMSVDPVDDCTFWYTNEYLPSNGTFNWSTRIASFKFPGCGTASTGTPDFALSVAPGSRSVTAGGGASYTVTITPSGGFGNAVDLSVSGLPNGARGSFTPNPAAGSSTLTVTTSASVAATSYPLTITGTSGALTHTASASLVVAASTGTPDFALSVAPGSRSVTAGGGASYTVTITPSGGFGNAVDLSVSGLPNGARGSFTPNPAAGSSTLTVTTSASVAATSYPLTITGTSGALTHTASASLVVAASTGTPDFALSVAPGSRSVTAGGGASYTVTITPSGGFGNAVDLSVSGLPNGARGSFTPNPAAGSSTLTVTTSARSRTSGRTPPGTYPLTITGTSGGTAHTTTVMLVVQ